MFWVVCSKVILSIINLKSLIKSVTMMKISQFITFIMFMISFFQIDIILLPYLPFFNIRLMICL